MAFSVDFSQNSCDCVKNLNFTRDLNSGMSLYLSDIAKNLACGFKARLLVFYNISNTLGFHLGSK